MKINKKEFNKWLKALRSGKYSQTKASLQDDRGYCCLGVGVKVLVKKPKLRSDGTISGVYPFCQDKAPKWLKEINRDFGSKTEKELATLNDIGNYNFNEIADLLELVYIHKILD